MPQLDLSLFHKCSDIYEHLELFYNTCLQLNAQVILELGVRGGESTKAFIEACKITHGTLISVDIVNCSNVSNWPGWTFIQADSRSLDINKTIDVLLLDTEHTYDR